MLFAPTHAPSTTPSTRATLTALCTHALHRDKRFWCYEYDPSAPGHVRVTYKDDIVAKATTAHAEMGPWLEAAEGTSYRPTDPRGVDFMLTFPDVMHKDPGLEPWKSGDPQEKKAATAGPRSAPPAQPAETHGDEPVTDGWNRKRVERDVLSTGQDLCFNSSQMEDWKALFAFHEAHPSPESLPMLPHTLNVSSERSYTMKGPPPWETLWRALRRFPRPHHSQHTLATTTAPPAPAPAPAATGTVAMPLALLNGVTGPHNKPSDKARAKKQVTMEESVQLASRSASDVEVGDLRFIALEHPEGELRVGLGRVASPLTGQDDDAPDTRCTRIEWLKRKGWSNDRGSKGYLWAAGPTFEPSLCTTTTTDEPAARGKSRKKRKVKVTVSIQATDETLDQILPLVPQLTKASTIDATQPLSKKKHQFVRLTSACMLHLREFLRVHRPELVEGQGGGEEEEGESEEEESEEDGEESEEEESEEDGEDSDEDSGEGSAEEDEDSEEDDDSGQSG